MRFARTIIPFLLLISIVFGSCEEEDDYKKIKDRTIIVYMLANNNLYSDALSNINEMESVWNNLYDGNLVVVLEPKSSDKEIIGKR